MTKFTLILMNRLQHQYRNGSTYMLWAITNNIYRNSIAFIKTIRERFTLAALAQHGNDMEQYLIFVKNHLCIIIGKPSSAKRHNGLITYTLHQLKGTSNPVFLRFIQDMHVQYQEAQLPKYTPLKLILEVEDKICVLKHAKVWNASTPDIPAMAMNANTLLTDDLKEFLANQITTVIKCLAASNKIPLTYGKENKDGKSCSEFKHQDWVFVPPSNPSAVKITDNHTY